MQSNLYVVDDKNNNDSCFIDIIDIVILVIGLVLSIVLAGIRVRNHYINRDINSYFEDNYSYYDVLKSSKYYLEESNKELYYYDVQYIENDSLYQCEYKIVVDFINPSKIKWFVDFKNDVDYKISYVRIK